MKLSAILILIGAACVSLLAQTDLLNINPVRAEAQKLLRARSSASSRQLFDLTQLEELHRAIAGNRPNVWKMPEPMLTAIQLELEPLRAASNELAVSPHSGERYYGAILNSYLKQTPQTRFNLIRLAHDESPETASTALDNLFGLKLETPELRAEIVASLKESGAPADRRTLHAISRNNAGEWGMTEAVPVLIKIAEETYEKERQIDSVVIQLSLLGSAAIEALPTLKKLLLKRQSDGNASFQEIEALQFAIQDISGQNKPRQDSPMEATPVVREQNPKNRPERIPVPIKSDGKPTSSLSWSMVIAVIVAVM